MAALAAEDLHRLRTRRLHNSHAWAKPTPNPEAVAKRERIEAECRRISNACVACRAKLQDSSEIGNPDLDAIEDCSFAALPACHRRSLIRAGQAVCPLGVWKCQVAPEPLRAQRRRAPSLSGSAHVGPIGESPARALQASSRPS